jgi:hypothetical protein
MHEVVCVSSLVVKGVFLVAGQLDGTSSFPFWRNVKRVIFAPRRDGCKQRKPESGLSLIILDLTSLN